MPKIKYSKPKAREIKTYSEITLFRRRKALEEQQELFMKKVSQPVMDYFVNELIKTGEINAKD